MSVRTTGALLQASDDTVTCIASLYFHTPAIHRSFLRSAVGCSRIKPSVFSPSHVIPPLSFPSSFQVERQEPPPGGRGGPSLLIPYRPWMQRSRPPLPSPPPLTECISSSLLQQPTLATVFSLAVTAFSTPSCLIRHGGGYNWKHEHQKVGDSRSYPAFVPGVFLHGRRFNW